MRRAVLMALLAATTLGTAFSGTRRTGAGRGFGCRCARQPSRPRYAAEQFSNTVSVTDPADNKLLGVIRLGDPAPANLSPLYRGQLLVHGMGFSPDHRTIAVVSIGSNSVTFIDTATNAVKHVTYVGRSPHEAFFTPDGQRGLGNGPRRELRLRARRQHVRGEDAHHGAERPGDADLLAGREVRLRLLVVHAGDGRRHGGGPSDRRAGAAGQPVLPQHRRDARTARRSGSR